MAGYPVAPAVIGVDERRIVLDPLNPPSLYAMARSWVQNDMTPCQPHPDPPRRSAPLPPLPARENLPKPSYGSEDDYVEYLRKSKVRPYPVFSTLASAFSP